MKDAFPRLHYELQEITEEHLNFSVLSEGLGFREPKVADTKATAPLQNANATEKSSGSGATQAGNVRFAPNFHNQELATATLQDQASAVSSASTSSNPAVTPRTTAHVSDPGVSAGIRFSAFLLDIALLMFPMILAMKYNFSAREFDGIVFYKPQSLILLLSLYLAVYFLLTESLGGQSLGKMILGLRIVEDDKYQKPIGFGTALKRMLLLPISMLPFGMGLFMAIWESKSRTWHDKVTASIVRYQKQ